MSIGIGGSRARASSALRARRIPDPADEGNLPPIHCVVWELINADGTLSLEYRPGLIDYDPATHGEGDPVTRATGVAVNWPNEYNIVNTTKRAYSTITVSRVAVAPAGGVPSKRTEYTTSAPVRSISPGRAA